MFYLLEGGLEKIFGKIINCVKWSDVVAVKLPDMVLSIRVFEKIWTINIFLESLFLVGCVIWGRNKYEDKELRNSFVGYFIKSTLSHQ